MYEYHSTSFIQTKQFGWVQKAEAINSFLIEELRLEMKLRFQNIYLLDMFKKTLLILAIICLVFNQSFACKKKIKGAWKKIKPKKPKRYQKLSPSSSVSSSASDISFIFRSRQGKITMVTLSGYSKTSRKFILNCYRKIMTYLDFKTFIY